MSQSESVTTLFMLLVGRSLHLRKLQQSILWGKKKLEMKCKLQVDVCEVVSDVLRMKNNNYDFIVVTFDTGWSDCLNEVQKNLSHLKRQLVMQRVCLASIADIPPPLKCVHPDDLLQLRTEYSLPLIFGDIQSNEKCLYLAERILILASAIIGLNSGIPTIC